MSDRPNAGIGFEFDAIAAVVLELNWVPSLQHVLRDRRIASDVPVILVQEAVRFE